MISVQIPVINRSRHPLPSYATPGSSGMDLRADLSEPVDIEPMQRMLIPTGISMAIPEGFEAQVRPRSGLALKQGLTCLNSPGTIDADYRGEIKVILINLSGEKQRIQDGDRIAQLVIQRVEKAEWMLSETLNVTERAEGGFGHTGKK
jgi:dUTP pyrophosphatase